MMKTFLISCIAFVLAACSAGTSPAPAAASPPKTPASAEEPKREPAPPPAAEAKKEGPAVATEKATCATGCFWCSEAIFQRVPGVVSVRSGFTGGTTANPSYEDVCTGETGHAEAVEVTFDPAKVSYETLVDWFWRMHDPTTLNRQGPDVGTQYRSAIFFHSEAQRAAAEKSKKEAQPEFADPIVTEITKAGAFYESDEHHRDFYNRNKSQGYCRAVIAPKLHKLKLEDK